MIVFSIFILLLLVPITEGIDPCVTNSMLLLPTVLRFALNPRDTLYEPTQALPALLPTE